MLEGSGGCPASPFSPSTRFDRFLKPFHTQVEDRPFNRSASDSCRDSNSFRGYFVPHHHQEAAATLGQGHRQMNYTVIKTDDSGGKKKPSIDATTAIAGTRNTIFPL